MVALVSVVMSTSPVFVLIRRSATLTRVRSVFRRNPYAEIARARATAAEVGFVGDDRSLDNHPRKQQGWQIRSRQIPAGWSE